jgi:hypothetical protein
MMDMIGACECKMYGILDNNPSWYLFVWKEEEGGERYKFSKQ